ncbi:MAG: rRNA maturation RNase YbeY [Halanaerobiales bacterium]|nr:rRNA maturation RNase YbeY [Halanaerobiales bacterium]
MIKMEINNQQDKVNIDSDLYNDFENIISKATAMEGYDGVEISIALVDNNKIKELNKKFRNKDEVTDVLSFPMDKEILGDIIISLERALSQSKDYGHSFKREVCFLVTHGILHLLGYNHKTEGEKQEMRKKEERILKDLEINR